MLRTKGAAMVVPPRVLNLTSRSGRPTCFQRKPLAAIPSQPRNAALIFVNSSSCLTDAPSSLLRPHQRSQETATSRIADQGFGVCHGLEERRRRMVEPVARAGGEGPPYGIAERYDRNKTVDQPQQ